MSNAVAIPNLAIPFNQAAIQMEIGKERLFQVAVTNRTTGLPVDLSAWAAFRFLAKINATDMDAAAVVTKTLGVGITVVSASQGMLQVVISPADTSALAETRLSLFASLQGTDAAAVTWPLWDGGLDLLPTAILAGT